MASLKDIATLSGHKLVVYSVAFSPKGDELASSSNDKTIKLWNVATRNSTLTLTGHTGSILAIAFSPDGKRLASGGDDESVRIWNVEHNN